MKQITFLFFAGALIGQFTHAQCDVTKTARQAVKSIVAVQDLKGISAYYGSVDEQDSVSTTINIQPHYTDTMDWYVVKVRNEDCRILSLDLKAENLSLERD